MAVFKFRDRLVELGKKTYVMGILNVTPDSFSDGGENFCLQAALKSAKEMEAAGTDFIDIGGQSTRPGCTLISAEEEWSRLEKILPLIVKEVSVPLSVDTFYPFVAKKALEAGCHIINDVSGKVNPKMAEVVREYSAGWVLMHNSEETTENICETLHTRLSQMKQTAMNLGVSAENICLDCGIGFGKTMEQNRELIKNTSMVRVENTAYLLGLSRKRVIAQAIGKATDPADRDEATLVANTIGIMSGADIIRVHNWSMAVIGANTADYFLRRKTNE